ncbi:MAG: HEAT repeat domain-containing protein [Chlorobi bacterium]|nr:HEAT repeat domain-containing protein [Chlorobiota bacterium]
MDDNTNVQDDLKKLQALDPEIKRNVIEKYLEEDLPDELVPPICSLIEDPESGVRDAVGLLLATKKNEIIPRNVVPFISSPVIAARNLAGEILIKFGPQAIDAIVEYLPDASDDDQKFLIDVLGLIGDKKPAKAIMDVLDKTENDNVLLACIEAMGHIKCENATEKITRYYDKNEVFQPTVIDALGKIGSDEAINFILEKYHEVDELTKFSMIESLGFVGNTQAFFLLLSELRNLNDALVWAAIESLNKLRSKLSLDVPFDENMKNAILSTLLEGEKRHKQAAAELLTAFDDKQLVEACLTIYGDDENVDGNIKKKFLENPKPLYSMITDYLAKSPANIKILLELIKEMIETDEGESFYALSEFEKRGLSDVLTQNLENPDEEARRNIIELLFFTDSEVALMFLDTMIQDSDIWNRLRILEIIDGCEDQRCIDAVKILANDPDEMVGERARQMLSMFE